MHEMRNMDSGGIPTYFLGSLEWQNHHTFPEDGGLLFWRRPGFPVG